MSATGADAPDPLTPPRHPVESQDVLSVKELVEIIAEEAAVKAEQPRQYFVAALIGGGMVSFGCVLGLAASNGVAAPGLASTLLGLGLGFSLVLILFSNATLVTADMGCGMVGIIQKRLSVAHFCRMLAIGFAGNAIGALIFVALAAVAGQPFIEPAYLAHIALIAVGKTGESPLTIICLGILCTWILETAAFLYFKVRGNVARMALAFYGPYAFVLAGTQHVITSVSFIGLPLLIRAFHPGVGDAALDALAWGFGTNGYLRNVLFVFVGNLIGSTVFGALPFVLLARFSSKKD